MAGGSSGLYFRWVVSRWVASRIIPLLVLKNKGHLMWDPKQWDPSYKDPQKRTPNL